MQEILTPRERFSLLVMDEKPDRCNIMPLITSHAANCADVVLKKYYTDGEAMAKAQIAALEEYSHDAIFIFSEVGILAEAMGSEFLYPDNDLPVLKVPVLKSNTVAKVRIPDPECDGRLPVYLEAIDYAYKAVGDRVPILAFVPAPFTTGMMLSEPDRFLVETIRNGPHVKEIMDLSLQSAIDFCYEIIDSGALPVIVDPLASSSVVSPKIYREFALPYEKALIKFLHRYDFDTILHICGNTGPILHLLPETGADLISLDKIELRIALEALSKKMRIIGNFNTSKLAFGHPQEITIEVENMVKIGKVSEKGFIASTGCEVPIKAPRENIKAFVNAAKEAGWFWE